jgi:hypothetical protein
VARSLLALPTMTTFATFAFVFLALCTPALADSPQPPRSEALKIRLSLKDGSAVRDYNVIVSPDNSCATAIQKSQDRDVELKACASRDGHLAIDWRVRSGSSEYHSTSSISSDHGSTTGPRLTVTVE